jgi:hypothetical protein
LALELAAVAGHAVDQLADDGKVADQPEVRR